MRRPAFALGFLVSGAGVAVIELLGVSTGAILQ